MHITRGIAIIKPTAGITPDDVENLVGQVAGSPLLMFIKEDEDLYPNLDYSPVAERTRRAVKAIERVKANRGGLGLVYAPHVTGAPDEVVNTVLSVLDAGVCAALHGTPCRAHGVLGGDVEIGSGVGSSSSLTRSCRLNDENI